LIDTGRHTVIESAHPSPLSAHNGFFGSRPFSRANDALVAAGRSPVDWDPDGSGSGSDSGSGRAERSAQPVEREEVG
jgi:hypothetical protein